MINKYERIASEIMGYDDKMRKLSDSELSAKTDEFKERLTAGESPKKILPEAFAVVREASARTIGLRHFKVQLMGGIALYEGKIAEMKTGEGKTLVATCPAYLAAVEGYGVHIVTVNDYLAKYNKEQMSQVFNYLGLSVGCILTETPLRDRKSIYKCDIVYGTNKEFGFDYLRDNMARDAEKEVSHRGFDYAIIDEADSILIDEARTPLIIAGGGDSNQAKFYEKADKLAKTFKKGIDQDSMFVDNDEENADFLVNEQKNTLHLTDRGVKKAEDFFDIECLGDIDNSFISHCLMQALRANFLMDNGKDYIVKNNEIIIVDSFTGRLMDGRRYNDGLHQAIEAKEKVSIQNENKTLATVTVQNYFRMYKKLSGMTGTAVTEKNEFKNTYKMDVVVIPTNKPVIRNDLPDLIFKTEDDKFNAILEDVKRRVEKGQPVLIGTGSIAKSEKLSKLFSENFIKHQVLNAKQYQREAEIVAQAGKSGTVTIATNMAGRGTDILLGGNPDYLAAKHLTNEGYTTEEVRIACGVAPVETERLINLRNEYNRLKDSYKKTTDIDHQRVVKNGGLYVIGTERAEAIRVDNQLRGRSGRQGDPGESQFYISLEDDLVDKYSFLDEKSDLLKKSTKKKVHKAQKRVETQNYDVRKDILEYDDCCDVHRHVFYDVRKEVLKDEHINDIIKKICEIVAKNVVEREAANTKNKLTPISIHKINLYVSNMVGNRDNVINAKSKKVAIGDVKRILIENVDAKYDDMGSKANDIVRDVIVGYMDKGWINHLENIDALRKSVALTGYGNVKPIDKFKKDSYVLFKDMFKTTEENILYAYYHIKYRDGYKSRQAFKAMESMTENEYRFLNDLAHELTMKSIHQGHMVTRQEVDEKVKALAKMQAEKTTGNHG